MRTPEKPHMTTDEREPGATRPTRAPGFGGFGSAGALKAVSPSGRRAKAFAASAAASRGAKSPATETTRFPRLAMKPWNFARSSRVTDSTVSAVPGSGKRYG